MISASMCDPPLFEPGTTRLNPPQGSSLVMTGLENIISLPINSLKLQKKQPVRGWYRHKTKVMGYATMPRDCGYCNRGLSNT